ncbi:adenine-specific DNA-methyltransferase [Treponema bryantii]|uniref:site-specific DNA-methyltransferase (adenine-specific) n=1 Tax=Treponema bryantii TaxID=163 RepID=A0A1I3LCP6_9SPIR|nr:DNA adenine methylase [Treponema bryantii]SFI82523.1 adenine-specific DNA-methyltransferase [Treponema bryantii]
MKQSENPEFLQNQLITYIGNKRALLDFIGTGVHEVQKRLCREKLSCLDVFAGSGIVSRYLKQYASAITVNDLEQYSCIINRCYLSDKSKINLEELEALHTSLCKKIDRRMATLEKSETGFKGAGFISELYAPADENQIEEGERCFYTPYNAAYLDVARQLIEKEVPEELRDFFIAPLLSEASIHANTAGIFKGFYKNSKTGTGQFGGNGRNALTRIRGKISLPFPVFSQFNCKSRVFSCDANALVQDPDLYEKAFTTSGVFDLAYFDPPYNQHPYGSNYFMLNLIAKYQRPDAEKISRVSGIPRDWNRSDYNKKRRVAEVFVDLVRNVKARFVLVSFNSEGFIPKDEMIELLSSCGKVDVLESDYNAFRGSRNLSGREIHVKEFLFLVEKK